MTFNRSSSLLLRRNALSLLCSVLLAGSVLRLQAQTPPSGSGDLAAKLEAIEKDVEAKRKELHVPGASLVIVRDDKVLFIKGFGLRDVEKKLPVTLQTLFAIGSSTKAFTAATVLMSAEEGKLALSDSPKKHLSYFRLRDPEADRKITISDLLCHRSGLNRTDIAWYTGALRPKEVIRLAGIAAPTAKFGEKFQYQNVMYLAAGEVVAAAQKMPWKTFVERRLLQPLGMKSSTLDPRIMQKSPDHALGYSYDAAKKTTTRLPMRASVVNIAPAGAIHSSAQEMAQWVRLILGKGTFEGRRLFSEASYAEMIKPRIALAPKIAYGYGWFLREWNGKKIVEHGGNIDGFTAGVALMPERKLGVVVLTNENVTPLNTVAAEIVWKHLVGEPQKAGEPAKPPEAPAGQAVAAEKEAGRYLLAQAKIAMDVTFEGGRLKLAVPGQPVYPLENIGGRRYKLGAPAPDGFFATFRPAKEDASVTEMYLEQPQGNVALKREKTAAFEAALTFEQLMAKVLEATGGATNLRKHRTLVLRAEMEIPEQGMAGRIVSFQRAPNAREETVTLTALGKKIATIRDYFDGVRGGAEISFQQPVTKEGSTLADAAITSDFAPELNWKALFKTVTITKMEKVGDEEAFVVEKTPARGSPITDYISTKTYLPLKREYAGFSETYHDYRSVDGVQYPFLVRREQPLFGKVVIRIKEIKFDVPVLDSAFKAKQAAR